MHKRSHYSLILGLIVPGWLILGCAIGWSQAPVNPDISLIGDLRATWHSDAPSDIGVNKLRLSFDEVEISATGYLNPYARADVFLGLPGTGGELEVEEASATIVRGLPLNLQLKAGQYLVDFGKLNTQHSHQWSWIERPLSGQFYLGDDGLKTVGVNLSTLVPVGASALTISGNLLKSGFFGEPQEATDEAPSAAELAGSARASVFVPVSDHTSFELGASGLYAQYDPEQDLWAKLAGVDFKLKWKPSMYRSLVLVAEGMLNRKRASETGALSAKASGGSALHALQASADKDENFVGFFSAVDYQFRRRFNVGALVDYAQKSLPGKPAQLGVGAFAGFSLAEETYRVQLLIRNDSDDELDKDYQTVILQLLWSLGPHKPHQY